MNSKLSPSDLEKAEKRLLEKGCMRKAADLWEVPLSVLKIDEKYCFRRSRKSTFLRSLAEDIADKGILNLPTAIYSLETDEIVLVVGFGRVASLKINQKEYVPCRIYFNKRIEPQEIFNLILSDNIHREDMKPIELALLYRSWMKKAGLSQKELAEKIHKSETYLSEILGPLKTLSEEEIDAILTSGLTRSQIMELAKIDDKDKRVELVDRKASVRKIRELTGKQKNKDKEANPRIFRLSDKAVKNTFGNVKIDLTIQFSDVGWKNADVVEILMEIIEKLRERSEEDTHLIPESFNF
jgi:ParB family transcriptional regulator, chromosome partitioning protein